MALTDDQIQIRFAALNTNIADLQQVVDRLQTKKNAKAVGLVIESRLDEITNDITAIEAAYDALEARVTALESA